MKTVSDAVEGRKEENVADQLTRTVEVEYVRPMKTVSGNVKVILGKPVGAHILLIEETIDLGIPMKQITRDGRMVETPNEAYKERLRKVEKMVHDQA